MFLTRQYISKGVQRTLAETKRQISKTASIWNSDALTPKLTENNQNLDAQSIDDGRKQNKMLKLQKYHRSLSTLTSSNMPLAASGSAASKEESREFMAVFPDLIRDLTASGKHVDVPEATKWLAKVLQYNVSGGKKNRGIVVVTSYKLLEKPENLTPENIRLANIMGWCIEMLQAYFIILDDIMDNSETRRGAPCWYRQPGVGLSGINDAILVQASIYSLLKKYFQGRQGYQSILETFNEMILKTSVGQFLDLNTSRGDKPDLNKFTMDKYNSIVKYKTSYYTFQMPVTIALLMTGIEDPEIHRQAKTILLEIGQFFQIQDDFLDCFGDPSVTGKIGTDIQEGKCSWLAVVALQRANEEQRKIMEEMYGSSDPAHVETIKSLYEELGLPHTYAVYEEQSFNIIKTHIQQISRGLPHKLFFKIIDTIYRRER